MSSSSSSSGEDLSSNPELSPVYFCGLKIGNAYADHWKEVQTRRERALNCLRPSGHSDDSHLHLVSDSYVDYLADLITEAEANFEVEPAALPGHAVYQPRPVSAPMSLGVGLFADARPGEMNTVGAGQYKKFHESRFGKVFPPSCCAYDTNPREREYMRKCLENDWVEETSDGEGKYDPSSGGPISDSLAHALFSGGGWNSDESSSDDSFWESTKEDRGSCSKLKQSDSGNSDAELEYSEGNPSHESSSSYSNLEFSNLETGDFDIPEGFDQNPSLTLDTHSCSCLELTEPGDSEKPVFEDESSLERSPSSNLEITEPGNSNKPESLADKSSLDENGTKPDEPNPSLAETHEVPPEPSKEKPNILRRCWDAIRGKNRGKGRRVSDSSVLTIETPTPTVAAVTATVETPKKEPTGLRRVWNHLRNRRRYRQVVPCSADSDICSSKKSSLK